MLPKYASTRNKEQIRETDAFLIKKEYMRKGTKLSYLGMPSGEMRDIIQWGDYLGRISAVEIDPCQRMNLALNVMRNGLEGSVTILFGDIQDILIKGKDSFGNKLEFPYDVVFLDFFGTILYKKLRRVEAIRSLIERQKGNDFLFLLTFNLKEKRYSTHTLKVVLDKIKTELVGFCSYDDLLREKIAGVIQKYKSSETEEMYRQKLFVPYFIKTRAEQIGFKVHCYPPVFYRGFRNNPMIHFSCKITSQLASPTHAISEQTLMDILNLNIKEVVKGQIHVRKEQMPCIRI